MGAFYHQQTCRKPYKLGCHPSFDAVASQPRVSFLRGIFRKFSTAQFLFTRCTNSQQIIFHSLTICGIIFYSSISRAKLSIVIFIHTACSFSAACTFFWHSSSSPKCRLKTTPKLRDLFPFSILSLFEIFDFCTLLTSPITSTCFLLLFLFAKKRKKKNALFRRPRRGDFSINPVENSMVNSDFSMIFSLYSLPFNTKN